MDPEERSTAVAPVQVAPSLPPLRGIILTNNRRGMPFRRDDLRKWVNLNVKVFHATRIDLLATKDGLRHLPELLKYCGAKQVPLSLRSNCDIPPPDLAKLKDAGLHDLFLCPERDAMAIQPWLDAAQEAVLPARVQLRAPFSASFDTEAATEILAQAAAVNVALNDPFGQTVPAQDRPRAEKALRDMNALIHLLDERGIEANLIHVPFCWVDLDLHDHALNAPQLQADHQHYRSLAYDFAVNMFEAGPGRLSKAIENLLARGTSVHNLIDQSLFPWIERHPRLYIRTWMFHKLTRHLPFMQRRPRPIPEDLAESEALSEALRKKRDRKIPKTCRECRLRRICDHENPSIRHLMPGVALRPESGEAAVSAEEFGTDRIRYYDDLDQDRKALPDHLAELAERARQTTLREPPTREINTDDYDIEKHYTHHMPGAARWPSFTTAELLSTVLTTIEPPFTLSLTFGGGIAEYIGFSFGRHAKICCPMVDYSHRLTLSVDHKGHYVLLRDGVLVPPTRFEQESNVPARLAGRLHPRISIRNIDGQVITQTLLLWEGGGAPAPASKDPVKYSVVIISTRYSRRLQAALLGIAHQQGVGLSEIEVVIGYVPGIDFTDDLIESLGHTFPGLRIVRSPFPESLAHSKGFMINESIEASSGEWVVLLDADVILPPDFFAHVGAAGEDVVFIAPDGRKMLSPERSAQVLLGLVHPWKDFDAIAAAEPAYRFREADRTPIGFCQCVRRRVFEKVQYIELDHFEASDWHFGRTVSSIFGPETRLEGVNVLHLDHGGSQWYGTVKHR